MIVFIFLFCQRYIERSKSISVITVPFTINNASLTAVFQYDREPDFNIIGIQISSSEF